jgi:mannose/fructose/N-acetylgalactosamine-specific phosphotransferase system component IID
VAALYVFFMAPITAVMVRLGTLDGSWNGDILFFCFPAVCALALWGIWKLSYVMGSMWRTWCRILERVTGLPFERWFGWIFKAER